MSKQKLYLLQLQSLTGSLAFCAKAMPSARAFVRQMFSAMKRHFHKGCKRHTRENGWSSSGDLQLFTDSAWHSKFGCCVYFNGFSTYFAMAKHIG